MLDPRQLERLVKSPEANFFNNSSEKVYFDWRGLSHLMVSIHTVRAEDHPEYGLSVTAIGGTGAKQYHD